MSIFILTLRAQRPGVDSDVQRVAIEHEPDVDTLVAFAAHLGIALEADVDNVPLFGGNGSEEIEDWLRSFVNVDPKPVIERSRTEIIVDELTRAMTTQERRVAKLTDTVEKLAQLVAASLHKPILSAEQHLAIERGVQPAPIVDWNAPDGRKPGETVAGVPVRFVEQPAQPVPRATDQPVDWNALRREASAPRAEVVHAEKRFERGRPVEYGAGSVKEALAENMQPNENRVVPGNMSLRGAPASSQMFGPGFDKDGNPGAPMALPKVGDSLKPKALGED